MSVYLTADLHLSHQKIADERGFASIEEHDRTILANIANTLEKHDQLWILGDISSGTGRSEGAALDLLNELTPFFDLHLVAGNHDSCLDAETRAVTQRGFVHIDDFRDDDLVLTVDDNLNAEWVKPSRRIKYPHSGTATYIRSEHVDSFTTHDHRIVGIQRTKSGWSHRWTEYRADEVNLNMIGFVGCGAGLRVDASVSDWDIRMSAWCHTDSNYRHNRWTFYQSEDKRDRIEILLKELDTKMTSRIRDITEICGKVLKKPPQETYQYRVLGNPDNERLSRIVPDRDHLAPWMWTLSERQVDVLVEEWVYTDGSISTTKKQNKGTAVVLYCSRDALRGELMALMTANGWRVSATEYRPGHWRINACKRNLSAVSKNPPKTVEYDGDVWCLTVPNGRFFVERNGRVHLTGNCHPYHVGSHIRSEKFLEVFRSIATIGRRKVPGVGKVWLSHFPYYGDGDRDATERYSSMRIHDNGDYLFHGHLHTAQQWTAERSIQVSLDAWDLRPVNVLTLNEMIQQKASIAA